MGKYKPPEKLNKSTPEWFKQWHDNAFWHFKYSTEQVLSTHTKLLWGIFATVLAAVIARVFIG